MSGGYFNIEAQERKFLQYVKANYPIAPVDRHFRNKKLINAPSHQWSTPSGRWTVKPKKGFYIDASAMDIKPIPSHPIIKALKKLFDKLNALSN
jgi:hypothetical protein